MLKLLLPITLLLVLAQQSPKAYNDLDDYGFMGSPKKITYSVYKNPVEAAGIWTANTKPEFTKTYVVNEYGQFTSESVNMNGEEFITTYEYRDSLKFKARVKGPYHNNVINYTYTQNSYTTNEYQLNGSLKELVATIKTTLNDKGLTVKEEIENYRNGKTAAEYTTVYTERDNGYISAYTTTDVWNKTVTTYKLTVLERDARGNPLLVVKKENDKPYWLMRYTYEY